MQKSCGKFKVLGTFKDWSLNVNQDLGKTKFNNVREMKVSNSCVTRIIIMIMCGVIQEWGYRNQHFLSHLKNTTRPSSIDDVKSKIFWLLCYCKNNVDYFTFWEVFWTANGTGFPCKQTWDILMKSRIWLHLTLPGVTVSLSLWFTWTGSSDDQK